MMFNKSKKITLSCISAISLAAVACTGLASVNNGPNKIRVINAGFPAILVKINQHSQPVFFGRNGMDFPAISREACNNVTIGVLPNKKPGTGWKIKVISAKWIGNQCILLPRKTSSKAVVISKKNPRILMMNTGLPSSNELFIYSKK